MAERNNNKHCVVIVIVIARIGHSPWGSSGAILQSVRKEKLAHYFPYDVKLQLLAHSRSFLTNQKARNAIVGAENLLTQHRPGV